MQQIARRNLPNVGRERTEHEPRGGGRRGVTVEVVGTFQTAAIADEQGTRYRAPGPSVSVPRCFRSVAIVWATFRITDRRPALYFVFVNHTPKIRKPTDGGNASGSGAANLRAHASARRWGAVLWGVLLGGYVLRGAVSLAPYCMPPGPPSLFPIPPGGVFLSGGGVPLTSPPGFFTRAKFSNPFGGRVSVRRPASRRWALTARRSCPFFDFRAFLAVREELGQRAPFVQNTAVSVALDGGRGTGGHL